MKVFPSAYYFVKEHNIIVGCTTKVASTSIGKAMTERPTVSRADIIKRKRMDKDIRVVLWIREPFDRFASAYRKFRKGRTPSEFFQFTLQNENRHWQSQVFQHSEAGIFLPNIILPFETIQETWYRFLPNIVLPLMNVSKNMKPWEEIREELSVDERMALRIRYNDDIYKWRLAVQQVLDTRPRV